MTAALSLDATWLGHIGNQSLNLRNTGVAPPLPAEFTKNTVSLHPSFFICSLKIFMTNLKISINNVG
jgi:hypothetical protein